MTMLMAMAMAYGYGYAYAMAMPMPMPMRLCEPGTSPIFNYSFAALRSCKQGTCLFTAYTF